MLKGDFDDRLKVEKRGSQTFFHLTGQWTIHAGLIPVSAAFPDQGLPGNKSAVIVDARQIENWDSALVCFILELERKCKAIGCEIKFTSLPHGVEQLISLASAVPVHAQKNGQEMRTSLAERIGQQALDTLRSGGEMLDFLGETAIAFGQTIRGKSQFRISDVWLLFEQCGPGALPIVSLISFLVGMILAFVGLIQLAQFGADIYIANLVAVAMVREMGGMMTGIIMAGRTGAAFAAQLGTMQVNDEIAALRTFGIQPVAFLVLPRMFALIIAVPLLTFYANVLGMIGGSMVTSVLSEVSIPQYYSQTITSVTLTDWASGLLKSSVYGVIIAAAGCLRGIQCGKNAEAVGHAATSAVVLAITMIIVAEAMLTVIYQILGV